MQLRKMLKVQIRLPGAKKKGKDLTKKILDLCHKRKIIGATVTLCQYGYGETEYKPHVLRNLTDLPQIVEIVDEPRIIESILPQLKQIVQESGLISIEEVLVL